MYSKVAALSTQAIKKLVDSQFYTIPGIVINKTAPSRSKMSRTSNKIKRDRADIEDETVIIQKKKKKGCFKPLDETMLIGVDGLSSIYENFHKKCVFHGRGSEKRDLANLLTQYKLWAFQLHPGTNCQDLFNKCEKMGKNVKVQTCLDYLRNKERQRYIGAMGLQKTSTTNNK
jgi:hypothetical protein